MTGTTGLLDNFGRTVGAGSWGTATSGQTYTLQGTASAFAVPGTGFGTITPNATATAFAAVADLKTPDVNVASLWQISALPASGTFQVGLTGRYTNSSNQYRAYVSVTAAGAVTVVLQKVVSGVVSTLVTSATITGLTIAANTSYGVRGAFRYDPTTQTMNLYAKVWATTSAEPYGWQATFTEPVNVAPPAGSLSGAFCVNSDAAAGAVFRYTFLTTANHSLPFPASADPMCYDPAVAYPRQTLAQSLAGAVDTYMGGTIDPDSARLVAPAWVKISKSNWSSTVDGWYGGNLGTIAFDTVEFNSGTPTDLTADPTQIVLGPGCWALTGEIQVPGSTDMYGGTLLLNAQGLYQMDFRIDSGTGTNGTPQVVIGGCASVGALANQSSGVTKVPLTVTIQSTSGNAAVSYLALTAVKISDYF